MVVFYNLYAIPSLLIIGLLFATFYHRKKHKYAPTHGSWFTVKMWQTVIFCSTLFICGILLVIFADKQNTTYENQPVFSDWKEQLNNISAITLEQNGKTLTFYQKDGLWQIKGYEDYPVYQRRIINFLAVLSNAKYLEKKSARAEYLSKFGLDKQNATTVNLLNADGDTVFQFDIGSYDEEIGRGGRGAFLKFTNRFQVWLIEADFISLSTNWREWTLNTALNPRFGLIKSVNKKASDDILILLVKELQITPLTLSAEKVDNLTPYNDVSFVFDNDDQMTIYFEQKDDKSYIRYTYGKTDNAYLKLFAEYTKNNIYEIPQQNMEKISDVFDSLK